MIRQGELKAENFMESIVIYARQVTEEVISIRFPDVGAGTLPCPKCHAGKMILRRRFAQCTNPECAHIVPRRFLNIDLTDTHFEQLFTTGATELIRGLKDKDGQGFDAFLSFAADCSLRPVFPEELGDICSELCLHHMQGTCEIASGQLFTLDDREPVRYAGVWQVIPDYELFFRIYRWWYNFDLSEALSKQSFEETFGAWMGGHYYEKWLSNERSISRMIGYFGEDTAKGRQFLDMVMEKVQLYEQRLAREN